MQLVVGRITRPHGVRGEVSVEVRTDEPDRRFAVGCVLATDPVEAGPLTVDSARWHSGRLLIRFAGVTDRNQAEDLRGIWLTLDSAEAGPTGDPDEFHDHELIGLAVVTTSGEPVGRVTDVRHFGQDLLVIEPGPATSSPRAQDGAAQAVRGPGGPILAPGGPARGAVDSELLVPFVAAIVPDVDVAAGRLVIDPPPGLLELAAGEPGQVHAPATREPDARPADAREPGTRPADTSEPGTRPADAHAADPRPADTSEPDARAADTRPAQTRPAATSPARTGPAGS